MIVTLQIDNADSALLDAIKHVVKLSPTSKLSIKKYDDFDIPNKKTVKAMIQGEKELLRKKRKTYSSVDELFKDLDS